MEFKPLLLTLNSRLSRLSLLNNASILLNGYYNRQVQNKELSINYRLLDRYPTFYSLYELLKDYAEYTDTELNAIANLVYGAKGSRESIIKFCKYFNIKIYELNIDTETSVRIGISELETDYREKFSILFTQLIKELLITDDIVKIIVHIYKATAAINNDVKIYSYTELLNYNTLNPIN